MDRYYGELDNSKKIIPEREERIENMGKPKPPKMGKISPGKKPGKKEYIHVPKVDDLLEQLKKITDG